MACGHALQADLFMNGMSRADGWLCGGRLLFLSNGTVLVWTVPVYNAFKFHLMPGAYLDSIWNA